MRQDRAGTVIGGASAGGQGTLRIALRRPELFAAAMEPGFPPVLALDDWDISGFGPNIMRVFHARFGDPDAERHKQSAIRKGHYQTRTTNELPFTPVQFDPPE